jgi:4-amino-4-deoxy-L-arabinose transferase-like glycosyltransferase
VYQGKRLVNALLDQGWDFFTPSRIRENFPYGDPSQPPFHPPLAHWLVGAIHALFDFYPSDPTALSIVSARLSGPVVLLLLLLLVGTWIASKEGWVCGVTAVWICGVMPRLFGHAHLVSLDLITALMCVAVIVTLVEITRKPNSLLAFALGGVVLGLAMLTRLHGFLIGIPCLTWLVLRLGKKAFLPAIVWIGMGLLIVFLGWPWLWLDPIARLGMFLVSSAQRPPIHVFYWGQVWKDTDVPWHYPLAIFAVTMPAGLLFLGLLGIGGRLSQMVRDLAPQRHSGKTTASNSNSGYELMILIQLVFWLGLFAWPGTPVYDGERLFLLLYPLWAGPVIWGVRFLHQRAILWKGGSRPAAAGLGLILLSQAMGTIVYRPVYLSYYNLLIGGLRGAAQRGFEVNYWGDAITEPVMEAACRALSQQQCEGGLILYGPNLAPFQAVALNVVFPLRQLCGAEVVGYDPNSPEALTRARVAVLYHRRADLNALPAVIHQAPVLYEYSLRGVWLARVVRLPAAVKGVD